MALKFAVTSTSAIGHGIKALIYGRSGAGKTYMARTAPAPLILSAESGVLSLRDVSIPMIEIRTVDDLTEAYTWLTSSAEAQQFQTIYIDSVSEIAEVILSNAKKQVKDPRQAYGELIEKMTMTLRAYRDIQGKHVVMLAKQESHKDNVSQMTTFGPSMPGAKLSEQIPYLFDEVFRLGIGKLPTGEEYRFLQTSPDLQYEAKDRSGSLEALEPPNLTHIFNKILATAN